MTRPFRLEKETSNFADATFKYVVRPLPNPRMVGSSCSVAQALLGWKRPSRGAYILLIKSRSVRRAPSL